MALAVELQSWSLADWLHPPSSSVSDRLLRPCPRATPCSFPRSPDASLTLSLSSHSSAVRQKRFASETHAETPTENAGHGAATRSSIAAFVLSKTKSRGRCILIVLWTSPCCYECDERDLFV